MSSANDLTARIRQIAERARQRQREPAPEPAPKPAKIVRLPLWPAELRTCPSCVLRSALFGVVRRGRRSYLERQIIAAWANTTIRYSGMRLDQADLDVWLAALHITRESGLGAPVRTSIGAMLKAMGRTQDGRAYEDFNNTIVRLTGCVVEITANRKTYGGSLIESFERDEDTGRYVLYLNPRLVVLFEDEAFALIDWDQRHGLRRDLSKWLHGYLLSHKATPKEPHRIGLEKLRDLCGSETGELWKFRQQIREAMAELQEASIVTRWKITSGDALEFVRPQRNRRIIEDDGSR
jgi:hypothetical protein